MAAEETSAKQLARTMRTYAISGVSVSITPEAAGSLAKVLEFHDASVERLTAARIEAWRARQSERLSERFALKTSFGFFVVAETCRAFGWL